jgi:hypothetical protein
MNCSPALKWSIALLLPLTLGWKVTVRPDNPRELNDSLLEFLARHQFDVIVTEDNMGQSPAVEATAGACRMLVGKISSDGYTWQLAHRFAAPTDHVFVVFDGRVYSTQPTSLTAASDLWSRFLRETGLVRHQTSVIAVVASATCDAERLPWDELSRGRDPLATPVAAHNRE